MLEWASPYSAWVYLALLASIVALLVIARRFAISERLRSWLVFTPRLCVMLLLLVVLLNPVQRAEHRLPDEPSQIHYLVDASRSMGLEQPRTRSQIVRQTIEEADQLRRKSDAARVQLFRFGQQLASVGDLAQLQPSDDATILDVALEQLPSRFSREPPRGVVVFSDGAVEHTDRLAELSAAYKRMGVPLHVFPVGSDQVVGDVAIDEFVVPPRVTPGTKATIRGAVRGTGFAGNRIVLEVKAKDRPGLAPLATLPITLAESAQPFELVVEANSDYGELVLEAPALPGEVTVQNNRIPFDLIQAARKLKVIYMEGTAAGEYHWIRDALIEDKDIECLAMVADQQYIERPRLLRVDDTYRGFPATREELLEYDCVICSDISLGAFTREQLDWTVDLVAERGGGFCMVGGITSFGAGHWDSTAWDQLIPIDMTGGSLGRGWVYHQFQISIPPEAVDHPVWRVLDDGEGNLRALSKIPPFLGTNYMQRLKPAATVLAMSATEIPGAGIMPVFACQSYGRGRTFAFAPDSTADWGRLFESQWGEQGDNRYFRRFWRNVVRWLCENSAGGNKRLTVESDRKIYRAGQPIRIAAHVFDEKFQPSSNFQLKAQLKGKSDSPQRNSIVPVVLTSEGAAGEYTGTLDSSSLLAPSPESAEESAVLPAREIEVIASTQDKEFARATVKVNILPETRELLDPRPRPKVLEQLARGGGGSVVQSAAELAALLDDVPAKRGDAIVARQPLWDTPWLWFLILGLLGTEWSLRRRAGYG